MPYGGGTPQGQKGPLIEFQRGSPTGDSLFFRKAGRPEGASGLLHFYQDLRAVTHFTQRFVAGSVAQSVVLRYYTPHV